MTTIAIDLQPQCRFTCHAANDVMHVHRPEQIVDELNRQAQYAHLRLLIENTSPIKHTLCTSLGNRQNLSEHQYFVFSQAPRLLRKAEECHGRHFLPGLPCPADYDHEIETQGSENFSACFHDASQSRSSGLIEWLFAHDAETIIIGGLATEHAIRKTACQLHWYGNWNVIVNLAACRGYTPEGTIQAVYDMRHAGVTVINDSSELPALLHTTAQPQYRAV
ncbi:MAG: isochorismatase family protein [Neisseria sp.]|nr:isochorismatase family protein [Neisseria sp.]